MTITTTEARHSQIILIKPIIKTSTDQLVISNAFIWAEKFYEGIYWLIRDKYMQVKSQDFVNRFGEYYEKYIEELLGFYFKSGQYEKVKPEE